MKIVFKPNQNSRSRHGTHDMLDVCDDAGQVWGSIHVDSFWAKPNTPQAALYERLRNGETVTLECTETKERTTGGEVADG